MSTKVTFSPSVNIDPIPTGAGGIVRGTTITVKGTADCVKETTDTTHPENDPTTENSPDSITEVAVRFGTSGTFETATPTGPVSPKTNQKTWSTWTTNPRTIVGVLNDLLDIMARVSAGIGGQAKREFATVTVKVDRTPP